MEALVIKKVEVSVLKFLHEKNGTSIELVEAMDKSILVLSAKGNKQHITTSLTKADLLLLIEFLKLRGIE